MNSNCDVMFLATTDGEFCLDTRVDAKILVHKFLRDLPSSHFVFKNTISKILNSWSMLLFLLIVNKRFCSSQWNSI